MPTNRAELLVTPEELDGELDRDDQVIVDCRFNLKKPGAGRQAWESGHIPGAFYADLDKDLASPATADSGRHPLPDPEAFGALLGGWGAGPETRVIAYDNAGGGIAARLWWLLRWVGHEKALLLDGGLPAWEEAGLPVQTEQPKLSAGHYPVKPGSMPVISVTEVQAALGEAALCLLDARAPKRFAGIHEPIDPVAGHVPGALNLPYDACLDDAGRFRDAGELQSMLQGRLGAGQPGAVACMCGSGVTACHIVFAMELAGLVPDQMEMPALYVGSWSEWIRSEERPRESAA